MKRTNLEMLRRVARALGEIVDQVVFVGGATVQFYATRSGAPEPCPTLDVAVDPAGLRFKAKSLRTRCTL